MIYILAPFFVIIARCQYNLKTFDLQTSIYQQIQYILSKKMYGRQFLHCALGRCKCQKLFTKPSQRADICCVFSPENIRTLDHFSKLEAQLVILVILYAACQRPTVYFHTVRVRNMKLSQNVRLKITKQSNQCRTPGVESENYLLSRTNPLIIMTNPVIFPS